MGSHTYQRASKLDVFKYSFGGLGSNLGFLITMSYLTYFYTDIYGVSTFVVAGLMLVSRLIDAITDPMMGMIADNTRSKLGRYRPWIMFGAPFLGLSIFTLFSSPNLSANGKIFYVYITYILYSLISTVVNIPYHSLTPVISQDPDQRTVIVSCKQGMSFFAQLLIGILALPLVEVFGGGTKGWATFGALVGALATISFWLCASGGKKYDVQLSTSHKSPSILKQLGIVFKNKPMMMLMIAFGTDILASAAVTAANVYYFKYILNRMDLVATTGTITLIAGTIVIFIMPLMAKKFGKKRLYLLGSGLSIMPLAVMLVYPTIPVAMLMTAFGISGFLMKIPGNLGWAMLPECVDYAEWKFGIRGDGLISSSLTFINKLGMAIGGSAASLVLGLVGFVPNVEQTPLVLSTIVFLRFGMPILGYIASLISMYFYEITSEKYAVIRAELNTRHAEAAAFQTDTKG